MRFPLKWIILGVLLWSGLAPVQVLEVPDLNLETVLREALVLSADVPITQQEMLRLKRLDTRDKKKVELQRWTRVQI